MISFASIKPLIQVLLQICGLIKKTIETDNLTVTDLIIWAKKKTYLCCRGLTANPVLS